MRREFNHLIIAVIIILNGFWNNILSQKPQQKEKDSITFKRFQSKDTLTTNTNAVLIIYSNDTFINYGIHSNKEENDQYIWYTAGICLQANDKIYLKSFEPLENQEALIADIKNSYLTNRNYGLISRYFEFVQIHYKDFLIFRDEDLVIDNNKRVVYYETP